MPTVVLTLRDREMLQVLAQKRELTIEHVAAAFFAADPVRKTKNTNPFRACERRLRVLASVGYVRLRTQWDGARNIHVVALGSAAGALCNVRVTRHRIAPRKRVHHHKTLEAIKRCASFLHPFGLVVAGIKLEGEVRSERQRGRLLQRGDSMAPCPDAVIQVRRKDGSKHWNVAVEYVTSKYTDEDIKTKHEGFEDFPMVYWFADKDSTAARVQRITGKSCTTLR